MEGFEPPHARTSAGFRNQSLQPLGYISTSELNYNMYPFIGKQDIIVFGGRDMKAPFSKYLEEIAPCMKEVITILRNEYDYVSVLSTDSIGFRMMMSQRAKSITNETMMTERGNVIRVYKDGQYSEYAWNEMDVNHPEELAKQIQHSLSQQFSLLKKTNVEVYETNCLPDEPQELFVEMETD